MVLTEAQNSFPSKTKAQNTQYQCKQASLARDRVPHIKGAGIALLSFARLPPSLSCCNILGTNNVFLLTVQRVRPEAGESSGVLSLEWVQHSETSVEIIVQPTSHRRLSQGRRKAKPSLCLLEDKAKYDCAANASCVLSNVCCWEEAGAVFSVSGKTC